MLVELLLLGLVRKMSIDDWVKATSSLVAVAASVVALVVSGFNAANYYADREARAKQENFNNQLSITKIYFERLSDSFCNKKNEALLLVQITNYTARELGGDMRSASPHPIMGLAQLMREDFEKRSCPGDARLAESAADAVGVTTVEQRKSDSTYAGKETVAQTVASAPTRAADTYLVYVQYRADIARARAVRAGIDGDPRFAAPAIERVDEVPNRNEIRIYKDTPADREAAKALQTAFLPDAHIVSLAKAYPNLRAGIMEVWLKE